MTTQDPTQFIYSFKELLAWRDKVAKEGKRIVLTNGCFDLLHRGHLSYLHHSAQLGDSLVVAINGDASVRELKGPSRPIHSEQDRAYAIASLRCVDAVFIFEGPRLDREITDLKPDIYTKAGDYKLETLDPSERAALETVHAKICFLPFVHGHSTTNIIKQIGQ